MLDLASGCTPQQNLKPSDDMSSLLLMPTYRIRIQSFDPSSISEHILCIQYLVRSTHTFFRARSNQMCCLFLLWIPCKMHHGNVDKLGRNLFQIWNICWVCSDSCWILSKVGFCKYDLEKHSMNLLDYSKKCCFKIIVVHRWTSSVKWEMGSFPFLCEMRIKNETKIWLSSNGNRIVNVFFFREFESMLWLLLILATFISFPFVYWIYWFTLSIHF